MVSSPFTDKLLVMPQGIDSANLLTCYERNVITYVKCGPVQCGTRLALPNQLTRRENKRLKRSVSLPAITPVPIFFDSVVLNSGTPSSNDVSSSAENTQEIYVTPTVDKLDNLYEENNYGYVFNFPYEEYIPHFGFALQEIILGKKAKNNTSEPSTEDSMKQSSEKCEGCLESKDEMKDSSTESMIKDENSDYFMNPEYLDMSDHVLIASKSEGYTTQFEPSYMDRLHSKRNVKNKVVGGLPSKAGAWPWVCLLYTSRCV